MSHTKRQICVCHNNAGILCCIKNAFMPYLNQIFRIGAQHQCLSILFFFCLVYKCNLGTDCRHFWYDNYLGNGDSSRDNDFISRSKVNIKVTLAVSSFTF